MPRPEEGLIHAWLDGQLPPDEAARVELLVATDAEWAAAAAEARGVIAASSRILLALDRVPSGVVPRRTVVPVARRLPWWTKMAAAVVLVAGASTLVMRRAPEPEIARPPQAAAAAAAAATVAAAAGGAAGAVDALAVPATARPATPAPAVRTAKEQSMTTPKAAVRSLADASSGSTVSAAATVLAVPAAAPTAAVAQVGGVSNEQAKSVAAAEQAPRAPQLDQAGQSAAQVSAQRASVEMRREMALALPARESARNLAASAPLALRARLTTGGCYELRETRTSAVVGVVMRGDRVQNDTLFLTPVRTPSPARAWVVAVDGVVHGVLTLDGEGRNMVLVSARPVACVAP